MWQYYEHIKSLCIGIENNKFVNKIAYNCNLDIVLALWS